ncbi:MAG: hypothetical protein KGI88_05160 [Betaproteobacteria bacterium]|nr:hypothetical protein [Betaproteobacteria bacterium]
MTDLNQITNFLESKWATKQGLLAAEITAISGLITLFASNRNWLIKAIILILTFLTIYIIWWWYQQPRKTKKNKIGFLVSISCSDPEERKRIQEDFVLPLQKSIGNGRLSKLYDFINAPEHIASKIITVDDAQALRIKARAHFMIYGVLKVRNISGKDTYIIHLDGIVTHQPIPEITSKSFAQEFGQLLPRRLSFAEDVSFQSLEFTSEWAELTSKYVIAVAAFISGDLDYSEELLNDVKDLLLKKNTSFPVYITLKDLVAIRISEIHLVRANWAYENWTCLDDDRYLMITKENLDKLDDTHKLNPNYINLRAILYFQLNADIDGAIKELNKLPKVERLQAWQARWTTGFIAWRSAQIRQATVARRCCG